MTGTFRSRAFRARSHSQSSGWSNVSPAPTSRPEISYFSAASRILGSATAGSRRARRALGNPCAFFSAQYEQLARAVEAEERPSGRAGGAVPPETVAGRAAIPGAPVTSLVPVAGGARQELGRVERRQRVARAGADGAGSRSREGPRVSASGLPREGASSPRSRPCSCRCRRATSAWVTSFARRPRRGRRPPGRSRRSRTRASSCREAHARCRGASPPGGGCCSFAPGRTRGPGAPSARRGRRGRSPRRGRTRRASRGRRHDHPDLLVADDRLDDDRQRPLEDVVQLADVARPLVALEELLRLRRERAVVDAVALLQVSPRRSGAARGCPRAVPEEAGSGSG